MKYKIYLEQEYKGFDGDLDFSYLIECDPVMLDCELTKYCEYLYDNCGGWEWMKNSNERILAIDENGNKTYFAFEVDYEPVFYISESK